MYLIPLAWLYVAVMMALAEASASNGSLLGAVITFALYGLLPVALILYFLGAPERARRRGMRDAARPPSDAPDAGSHAPGAPIAPIRKEP